MRLLLACIVLLCGSGLYAAEPPSFELTFHAEFSADEPTALASIEVSQSRRALRSLNLQAPASKYQLVSADGKASQSNGRLKWQPPKQGGKLTYRVVINSRKGEAYDARHAGDWVIMRLDDLFPAARSRITRNASSSSILSVTGPDGWGFESAYGKLTHQALPIAGTRNFNRPKGWLMGGRIGTRRDFINGRMVAVTSPAGGGMRRQDTLAFLQWTLPELARVFPDLPDKLLIVGAPKGMWRGGLSGPGSLYLHVDRPLISENATSPILHEIAHLGGLHSAARGGDWIVEGMAEYYGLLALRRSGGISRQRFERSIDSLRRWAERDGGKLASPSKGADTAAAVVKIHADAQALTAAGRSIDQLTRRLLAGGRISSKAYQRELTRLLQTDLD